MERLNKPGEAYAWFSTLEKAHEFYDELPEDIYVDFIELKDKDLTYKEFSANVGAFHRNR